MKSPLPIGLIAVLLISAPLAAQEKSKLPLKVAVLIEQLESWEEKKRKELEAELDAKRGQVARLLELHQEEATKNGDLDGAIAIRELIKELRENSDEKKPGGVSTDAKTESDRLPVGSIWVSTDSKTTLTIAKRTGDSFHATLAVGEHTRREIKGRVKGNQLSWRSKDVRAISGGKGGDNVGTINGEWIDLVWTTADEQGGKLTLKRSGDSK